MNPIRTNKPVFFGEDGDVLKSGKIYIGQPNQWPLDFPKTVTFQDSAGSQITAQQPLRTNSNGRIVYNGKAIIALVDGDYSMLVRDRNDVTVPDGYTPFVANSGGGGSTTDGVTQVGLLLSDIKLFDVTPGDTVRNVGKITAIDSLGADWLVVSSTGNPADDVDLIDFSNGTQGKRVGNKIYKKDFPFGIKAEDVPFDGATSGISDADVQAAIDKALFVAGKGRVWQNLTGSRVSGSTYVNSTGRDIQVVVSASFSANTDANFFVEGSSVATLGSSGATTATIDSFFVIVPDGATYRTSATSIISWWELR